MVWLVLGMVLFLGVHSVAIVAPGVREHFVEQRGEMAWKGLYSLVSVLGFVLIVVGYGAAREHPLVLYHLPTAARHATALLMLPVFVLLLAAYLPGRIQRTAKHPMLLATKLWALSHLLANGTLADMLLFGGFLAWAVADRISVKRRSAAGPLRPVPALPASGWNDALALLGGLSLYVGFTLWAHAAWIGVRPFG
jgi:uncharacterized membrane protein